MINLSLGGPFPSLLVKQAIDYAVENDVVVVAATGNDYAEAVSYPAAFHGVIAVGAVDWNNYDGFTKASFSNWGAQVDLVAPGVDIYSTDLEGSYSVKSGTSMATPFVAGYAALLKADDSSLSCDEILDIMVNNAYDLANSEYFGEGLINLDDSEDIKKPIWYRHLEIEVDTMFDAEYRIDCELLDYKYKTSDEEGTYYLYYGKYENNTWISQPRTLRAIEVDDGFGSIDYDFSDEAVGTYGLYMMDPNNRFVQSNIEQITVNPIVTVNISLPDGKVASENGFEGKIYFNEFDVKTFYISSGESTFKDEIEVPIGSYTIYAVIEDKENDLYYDTIFYNDENQQTETYYEGIEDDLQTSVFSDKTINLELKTIQHEEDAYSDNIKDAVSQGSDFIITDAIDYYGDIDYFGISMNSEENYCISLTNTSMDLEVALYSGGECKEKYIGYQDIYLSDFDGEYTLSVSGYQDIEAGPYTLEFKSVEDDYDDTFEDAAMIELDTSIMGGIDFSGDVDTLKFNIIEDGYYIIRSFGDTDTIGELYDSNKELVTGNDDSDYDYEYSNLDEDDFADVSVDEFDDDDDLNFCIEEYLNAGDYYLDVWGYKSEIGKYSLKVITDDYSDAFEKAHNINIGSTANATINDLYDTDTFRFTTTDPGIYYITWGFDDSVDLKVKWYDDDKTLIKTYDDRGNNDGTEIVKYFSNDETYYLEVEGYEIGDYQIAVKGDTEAITFRDANFEGAIRNLLGFDGDEDIYASDCLAVNILDLSNKNIEDISDLIYFKNLVSVDLSNNQVTTIPNLGLEHLGAMDLSNNNISDISALSSLDKLLELYLSNNKISDVSALAGMDLLSLMLDDNDITDITSLQAQNYLKVLYMDDNNIKDASPVSSYYSNLEDKDFIIANNVSISGTAKVDKELTVDCTYSEDDVQDSTYRWLTSSTKNGEYTAIDGAESKTYKLTSSEKGKYIKAEVTPKSNTNGIGIAVTSSPVGKVEEESSSSPGGGVSGGGTLEDNTNKNLEKSSDGKSKLTVKPPEGTTTIDATWEEDIEKIDVVIPKNSFDKALENKKSVVVKTNKVKMEIPTDVIDEEGEVSLGISELSLADIKAELKEEFTNVNENAVVFDFDFSVEGKKITKFNKPLTITIDFDASKVQDQDKLGVYYYNESEGNWEYVGGKVNDDGTITFNIDHFSKYAVMEYDKTFDDIQSHWAKKQIEIMASKHITQGISEDLFAPEKVTTRAEFTTWLVRALDLDIEETEKIFNDVSENEWFFDSVNKAYEAGIINGVGKNVFAPQKQITREEMASLIMRAYEYSTGTDLETMITTQELRFSDMDEASSWATRNITLANALGLISGYVDGTFKPSKSATRAEAMAVISRLVNEIE